MRRTNALLPDELIRAAVHTGQFSDPAAEPHLASVLMKRRDAVGRTCLPAINPVVDPQLDPAGLLTFKNAAVAAGFAPPPAFYHAAWLRFDNATGETRPIAETRSTTTSMVPPSGLSAAPRSFIEIDITADRAGHPSWKQPARTFFRRTTDGWKLVGFERLSGGTAAAAGPQRAAKDVPR